MVKGAVQNVISRRILFAMTDNARAVELPLVTVTTASHRAGVSRTTVLNAINAGVLPVYTPTTQSNGTRIWLVRPADVDKLWSVRKHPLKHAVDELTELINA